jgi:hypothetical protein
MAARAQATDAADTRSNERKRSVIYELSMRIRASYTPLEHKVMPKQFGFGGHLFRA